MEKLSTDKVFQIREAYLNGASQSQLAKRFNTSKKTIYRIVNLQSYENQAIPKHYKHRLVIRKKSYKTTRPRLPIIEIGCAKRQGKDIFAKMLKGEFENLGFEVQVFSFAKAMKEIVAELLNISVEELEKMKENNEKICLGDRETNIRELLILFGNGKMKEIFGKNVWVDVVKKQLDSKKVNIITDFRFEEEYIPEAITVQITRDSKKCDFLENFNFDFIIENDGNLEDLKERAKDFVNRVV